MCRVFLTTVIFAFFLTPQAWAGSKEEARAVIARAIKAQGGEALLGKAKAVQVKSKGILLNSRFTSEVFKQLPGQYKVIIHLAGPDEKIKLVVVLNGEKCWVQSGQDKAQEDPTTRAEMNDVAYVDAVSNLLSLLKENDYSFTPIREALIQRQPATGVRVASRGHPDVNLYFAKADGLLIKVEFKHKDRASGKEHLLEQYFIEYQEVESVAVNEQALKAARIAPEGAALLDFLRKRTLDDARRSKAKPLIRELGNAEFEVREKAERQLLALGEAAVPSLSEAVNDSDPEIARRSRELLKKIGNPSDPNVVLAAIRHLAYRKTEGAAEVLLAYLPSAPNEEVRQEAQAALAAVAVRDGKPDKVLLEALSAKDPARRTAAAAALGQDGDGKDRPARRVFLPGFKVPMKGLDYRDGKEERSWEVTEVKFFDSLPESTFAKPK